mmetsp:Transcript_11426/g.7948  ORF Transcript_11426/g.7948 Transcript_11426/m.7948 type:complete len:171 (+) Transcript_11426:18-530(+)
MQVDSETQSRKAQVVANPSRELLFDQDRLKIYYQKIFPYKLMFKWISYNKVTQHRENALKSIDSGVQSDYFYQREFSFTLENDVYCRYLSFKTADDFKNTLVDRVPFKIDIGAVFNMPPVNHHMATSKAFVPQQKEMVFDIDMDVYDDVRSCCKGANVCDKCMILMKVAA